MVIACVTPQIVIPSTLGNTGQTQLHQYDDCYSRVPFEKITSQAIRLTRFHLSIKLHYAI